RRVASRARSRSRNCRSMALTIASPASRTAATEYVTSQVGLSVSKPTIARAKPGRDSDTQAQPFTPKAVSVFLASPAVKVATSRNATTPGAVSLSCAGNASAASGQPGGYGASLTDQAQIRIGVLPRTI